MSNIARDETPWPRCTCAHQITAACPVHGKHTAVAQPGESEVMHLRQQLRGAVAERDEAVRLLRDARPDLVGMDLRRTWRQNRKALLDRFGGQ